MIYFLLKLDLILPVTIVIERYFFVINFMKNGMHNCMVMND